MNALGKETDWFLPLHGYDSAGLEGKVAAALDEGELLGVIAAGRVSELGEHVRDVLPDHPADPVAELAQRCTELLAETGCSVILQSDLTTVVSGEPDASTSRVLSAAANIETRSAAATWRFTPDSVRTALDAGWSAEELLTALGAMTEHPLPQPLEYLITDVARRHGQVRVRGLRSCIPGEETTLTEIMHTRSLHDLHLSQLSHGPGQRVRTRRRTRPVARCWSGTGGRGRARSGHRRTLPATPSTAAAACTAPPVPCPPLPAINLAKQLAFDPDGDSDQSPRSATFASLAELSARLNDAELELLSDAVDHHHDVVITYRDRQGSRTTRAIRPQHLFNKWLDAWCHLREGQRDFTVANIETVSPHPV